MKEAKVKTLLVGTSEYASKVFENLLKFPELEVVGIITQPDKPFGRKKENLAPPVKKLFENTDIKIYQPVKFKAEYQDILDETKPELVIVCAYGKILPEGFLNYPKFKCINIHGSVLPKYRGATPVQTTILNGDDEAGITLQVMSKELDEGDIIASTCIGLNTKSITVPLLFEMLVEPTVSLLRETLHKYLSGMIVPTKQSSSHVSYCYISDFTFEKGEISFKRHAAKVDQFIRAFNPEPGSWVRDMVVGDKKFEGITKIIEGRVYDGDIFINEINIKPGDYFVHYKRLLVKCLDYFYEIQKIQPANKNVMLAADFINGLNSKKK